MLRNNRLVAGSNPASYGLFGRPFSLCYRFEKTTEVV
jgi:hypothetical protein